MKRHYIYFSILPVLLFVACLTPMTIWEFSGERTLRNAFDDPTGVIFLTPTLIATVLLLIPNYVTAIIGTVCYLLATGLAGFMVYVLTDIDWNDRMGPAPFFILTVLIAASVLSTIHSVKMTKKRPIRPRKTENMDILDI